MVNKGCYYSNKKYLGGRRTLRPPNVRLAIFQA